VIPLDEVAVDDLLVVGPGEVVPIDQLPLRQQEALVTEALGECFGMWNQRVEKAFVAAAGLAPHDQLAAILHAAIDSFAELRSSVHACVETYAPALRSEELRERMAAGYATVRESAVQRATKAMHEGGMRVPDNLARSLGDPTRLAIHVRRLAVGPARVTDLVEASGLAQSTVSKHLACLRECGLVARDPVGALRCFG
jgi:DNA-binding transcriptional ArsR family regulator